MNTNQPKLTLRELAREYAGGRIDRSTFLRRRAKLLEELANSKAAKVKARPIQTPPPPPEPVTTTPVPGKLLNKALISAVTLVVILGLVGLAIFLQKDKTAVSTAPRQQMPAPHSGADIDSGSTEAPADLISKEPLTPVLEDAIRHFVETDDWSPESLAGLLESWNRHSPAEHREVQSSSWFLSLSSELQAIIKEEQGLSSSEHSDTVDSLIQFGIQLGLDYTPPPTPIKPTPSLNKPDKAPIPERTDKTGSTLDPPSKHESPKIPDSRAESGLQLDPKLEATSEIPKTVDEPPLKKAIPDIEANEGQVENIKSVEQEVEAVMEQPLLEETESEAASVTAVVKQTSTESIEENCQPRVASRRIIRCRDMLSDGTPGPSLRLLPGGLYRMGNNTISTESPAHHVQIPYPLAISTQEVSYGEYVVFCKATGSRCPPQPWEGNHYPVVNVNREDAARYAQWLNQQTRRAYRLPTEAEWEYAARADSTGPYPIPEPDLGTYARYSRRTQETSPLPRQPQRTNPNSFGLFHMAGNVREWVMDSWYDGYAGAPNDGSPRKISGDPLGVVRGGSFADKAASVRSSAREKLPADTRDRFTGFRLARDIYTNPSHEDLTQWGDWWLAFQQEDLFTIQLFAVNQLDEVNRIINANPQIPLKVVTSNDPAFGYRILHGLFESDNAAKSAYLSLPEELKVGNARLQIKSIREIR